ncbi:MAG: GNAT family N-acetyltransferase [Tessaracoccus sp.]|uniref:GNAT family N-acetyltransferase n=1 Tax=Tessaracoccus sp. TaxID=1971211 RepID=UPI001ECBB9C8|nr:GNAT family N-acetyltransferase [Tessaracoccus sp.]MBK7821039.1 GNAT family N-acetyltransferase [Tessaracoccus sp.]
MNDIEFRTLVVPTNLDGADAADFVAMADIRNVIYREINGNGDEDMTAAELLPYWQPSPDEIHHGWLVLADGEVIGRVGVDIPLEEGSRSAYWQVELLRAYWGRGIGTSALPLVEQTARGHGRTLLQSWAQHAESDDQDQDRVAAPTGFGTVPMDHVARFYVRHGYELGQIERKSGLELNGSLALVEQLLDEARPDGYSLVRWMLPTPHEYVDDYARMKSRMSTDAPSGEMEYDAEAWDAARVERHDQRMLDGGQTVLVTAARHDATGQLAGFTELAIGEDKTLVTSQVDTLVLSEHRGNRLGQWLKCANLLAWREIAPDSGKVITYNAEENRYMLDVNEAMGFAPLAYIGAWKKTITL